MIKELEKEMVSVNFLIPKLIFAFLRKKRW